MKALEMSWETRGKPGGVMFHSDPEQSLYEQAVPAVTVSIPGQSISQRGKCGDNSPMERFSWSLKNEWMPVVGYVSFREAAHAITDYIVEYYSTLRPHEYNGGYPPKRIGKSILEKR